MKIKRVIGMNALCTPGMRDKVVKLFEEGLGCEIGPEMPHLAKWGHKARVAYVGTEGEPFHLEISEAINEELPIGKQHKRLAPTFQALGLVVDNIDEAIAYFRAKGFPCSDKVLIEDPAYEYMWESSLHPKNTWGLWIELMELKEKPRPKQPK